MRKTRRQTDKHCERKIARDALQGHTYLHSTLCSSSPLLVWKRRNYSFTWPFFCQSGSFFSLWCVCKVHCIPFLFPLSTAAKSPLFHCRILSHWRIDVNLSLSFSVFGVTFLLPLLLWTNRTFGQVIFTSLVVTGLLSHKAQQQFECVNTLHLLTTNPLV